MLRLLAFFTVAVASVVGLYYGFTQTYWSGLAQAPKLGTVEVASAKALRRSNKTAVWENLKSGDIIYLGDSLRTGEGVGLLWKTKDGGEISLSPESFVDVERTGGQLNLRLRKGKIRYHGSGTLVLLSNSTTVKTRSSDLTCTVTEFGSLGVELSSGVATILAGSKVIQLKEGQKLHGDSLAIESISVASLSNDATPTVLNANDLKGQFLYKSPASNTSFVFYENAMPVAFEWQQKNSDLSDFLVHQVEFSKDLEFKRDVHTIQEDIYQAIHHGNRQFRAVLVDTKKLAPQIGKHTWYWRVKIRKKSEKEFSFAETQSFTVDRRARLDSPSWLSVHGSKLQWKPVPEAVAYQVYLWPLGEPRPIEPLRTVQQNWMKLDAAVLDSRKPKYEWSVAAIDARGVASVLARKSVLTPESGFRKLAAPKITSIEETSILTKSLE